MNGTRCVRVLIGVVAIGCATHDPIAAFTVRDQHFKVIRATSNAADLAAFSRVWNRKTETSSPQERPWTYKVDIHERKGALKGGPIYRIEKPDELNALLGIPKSAAEGSRTHE